jgi:hypothetical protein
VTNSFIDRWRFFGWLKTPRYSALVRQKPRRSKDCDYRLVDAVMKNLAVRDGHSPGFRLKAQRVTFTCTSRLTLRHHNISCELLAKMGLTLVFSPSEWMAAKGPFSAATGVQNQKIK